MGVSQTAVSRECSRSEERQLRVVLEVERSGPCRMDEWADRVMDVEVRLDEESCNVDATVRGEDDSVRTMFFSEDLCSYCPGKVLARFDCLPRYRRIDENSFIMETFVSDTEMVSEIVASVREISDNVLVKSIVPTDSAEGSEIEIVDLTELTGKQRRALSRAQETGYYDPDRQVSLEELAADLSISTSALSQLLKRAEANVVRQLDFDR
ncbi:MAG: helix-turn-helix domain-containing protein [Halodesulfurarchaeum sp.]